MPREMRTRSATTHAFWQADAGHGRYEAWIRTNRIPCSVHVEEGQAGCAVIERGLEVAEGALVFTETGIRAGKVERRGVGRGHTLLERFELHARRRLLDRLVS